MNSNSNINKCLSTLLDRYLPKRHYILNASKRLVLDIFCPLWSRRTLSAAGVGRVCGGLKLRFFTWVWRFFTWVCGGLKTESLHIFDLLVPKVQKLRAAKFQTSLTIFYSLWSRRTLSAAGAGRVCGELKTESALCSPTDFV